MLIFLSFLQTHERKHSHARKKQQVIVGETPFCIYHFLKQESSLLTANALNARLNAFHFVKDTALSSH
jgi:hypothetical protein